MEHNYENGHDASPLVTSVTTGGTALAVTRAQKRRDARVALIHLFAKCYPTAKPEEMARVMGWRSSGRQERSVENGLASRLDHRILQPRVLYSELSQAIHFQPDQLGTLLRLADRGVAPMTSLQTSSGVGPTTGCGKMSAIRRPAAAPSVRPPWATGSVVRRGTALPPRLLLLWRPPRGSLSPAAHRPGSAI